MELPLLSPATPDIQAAPVVKPQAESGARIAQAGGEVQETARNIWLYNKQARYDHDAAWTNAYTGSLQGVTDGVNADIHAGKIGPDTAAAETTKRLNDIAQPYIAQSTGEFKEKLQGILIAHSKAATEQAVIHATAENVQRQDANYKRSVDDLTNQIPFTPPDGQPPLLTQLHGSIDDYGKRHNLPPATVQDMQDDANAKVALGHFQVMARQNPEHALMQLNSPDFAKSNPWIARVGGVKVMDQLSKEADYQIHAPLQQIEAEWARQKADTITAMYGKAANGNLTPGEVQQAIDKRWITATEGSRILPGAYRSPQEPSDPYAVRNIRDSIAADPIGSENTIRQMAGTSVSPKDISELMEYQRKEAAFAKTNIGATALQLKPRLTQEFFPPSLVDINPKATSDRRADFQRDFDSMAKEAHSTQDLYKGVEQLRKIYGPEAPKGSVPIPPRLPREDDATYGARLRAAGVTMP